MKIWISPGFVLLGFTSNLRNYYRAFFLQTEFLVFFFDKGTVWVRASEPLIYKGSDARETEPGNVVA